MESGMVAAGLTTLALGGAMTMFGVNAMRQNRRREAARTALLARLAFPGGLAGEAATDPPIATGARLRLDEYRSEPPVAAETLFSEPTASGAASRRTAALLAICVAFVVAIGTYRWLAGAETSVAPGTSTTTEASATPSSDAVASATTVSVPPPVQPEPRVELLSLGHRVTPAAFVVTGQVRNQAGGAPLTNVVAVVGVMDARGRLLTTVRTPLKRSELKAGEISEFSAAAANATGVAQYRVEFQDSARLVIPHFDRRKKE
jgi:hypothetical protein